MTTREIFLKSPHREPHERWVATNAADAARDTALLLFVQEQPLARNPDHGWDCHSQLIGARRVLEILFKLHLPEEEPKITKLPNIKPPGPYRPPAPKPPQ